MAGIESKQVIEEVTNDDKKLQDVINKYLSDWYLSDDEVKNILQTYDKERGNIKSISKSDRKLVDELVKEYKWKSNISKTPIKKEKFEYPDSRKLEIRNSLINWINKVNKKDFLSNWFWLDFEWIDITWGDKEKSIIILDRLVDIIVKTEKENSAYIKILDIENVLSKKLVSLLNTMEKAEFHEKENRWFNYIETWLLTAVSTLILTGGSVIDAITTWVIAWAAQKIDWRDRIILDSIVTNSEINYTLDTINNDVRKLAK